ncbi:MAG: ABC transporter permease [Sphingobacteriaceae bacterium]|nr:ABC transporter permease [Sphingobacteriaceae bacterium]
MFKEIFLFELKLWLKRPGVYIYFVIFFAISFLLGAAASGMFSEVTNDTNTYLNSPIMIGGILTSFSSDYLLGLITILVCVALMAGCVQKDFQYNCFPFYFTKPFSKTSYLFGRFTASFLLTVLVSVGLIIGLYLAFAIAPNENGQITENHFSNYLQAFLIFTLPNVFMIGSVFFSLVTWTRNMTSGYVGSLLFLVIAGIARTITSDLDNKTMATLIDPFGQQALQFATEYWTPAESNVNPIPFSGYILVNRVFWFLISLLLLGLTFWRFNFNQFLNPVSIFSRKKAERKSQPSKLIQTMGQLPKVTQVFDRKLVFSQILFLSKFEFRKISRSIFFYIIISLCILLTVLVNSYSGVMYGTVTWPVTYKQIDTAAGLFTFFLLILVIFYSGVVVWRERDCKIDELVGASPVKNIVLFTSKFISIVLLCLSVFAVCMLTCIGIQTYEGYYNYEIGLYVRELFGMKTFSLIGLVALALNLQVFFKNRYIGFFATVLVLFGIPAILNAFDYSNDLLRFNSGGGTMTYSDMNKMGHTVGTFFVNKFYWLGIMLIFATFAVAIYQRGKETSFKTRFKVGMKGFNKAYKLALLLGGFFFVGCGSVIYYNIRVLNPYVTSKMQEQKTVDFELAYKKYKNELQPRVVESNLEVDIYPDELGATVKGYYFLKNKNKAAVKRIFVNISERIKIETFKFSIPSKKFIDDQKNGFYGYELNSPLNPGDSIKFDFDLSFFPKNFIMKKQQTQIVENGTFFNSGILPSIGYSEDSELGDNATRKKYNLSPKPRMASVYDSSKYGNTYISSDADWIRFECKLSTKDGQIAIAPGYLQKEWKDKDPKTGKTRSHFHYKMDAPILNFYAFLSAEYEVKKDKWVNPIEAGKDVNIEIYHHKGHEYNIDVMIDAIKASLSYYSKNFSPYQHKQVRILEFPRYSSFAQSFPNTIPYSESIGFIARLDESDPDAIDYTYYVTAHEVAHQWWAHQVIGANVQGCTVMSETMSQYSALMVMEKKYGKGAMRKFLKYEMNSYLGARSGESKKEQPLILCENQQYIHYNKGSVVMYALKDYIGEDSLNNALKKYIQKVGFQEPPFTTSMEFYDFIKNATPDTLLETVKDLFERIVVFDNKVKDWSYQKMNDGKFKITATIECYKSQSDSVGKAKEVDLNDWIDVGVFGKNDNSSKILGESFYLKKHKFNKKSNTLEVIVDQEPFMFGVDPYNKLIDKNPGDNSRDKNGKEIGGGSGLGGGVSIQAG